MPHQFFLLETKGFAVSNKFYVKTEIISVNPEKE